ncbi:MAG TPA: PqqD family protein [Croceibacterium sp.]|nr:PqqD family protein [Croceibacterium sp.]
MAGTPRKIAARFIETEIDDEIVVLRLSDADVFSLLGTSREIWACIDGVRSLAAIIDALADRHGMARERVAADVERFVAELCDAGFVELA